MFQVAIKIIDLEQGKKDYVMKNLTREAKVLSMLQHPSIVRLYETIRVSEGTFSERNRNLDTHFGTIDQISLP